VEFEQFCRSEPRNFANWPAEGGIWRNFPQKTVGPNHYQDCLSACRQSPSQALAGSEHRATMMIKHNVLTTRTCHL